MEPLNEREREIVGLMKQGLTNGEIAKKLYLTEGTVKWYNTQIFGKLGAKNRVEAIRAYEAAPPAPTATPATQLVGRQRELAELKALLAKPETRLVTVLGPGGMGKTTLAQAYAQGVSGAVQVALGALTHGEQMLPALADALGMMPQADKPLRHA